ncbi:MAG TPA: TetR/AcrR family transcriptional regulator [Actinotalea sp.]|nr:TetR/AcrR family transcriptional regulator [Actinotalea sp.]
MARPRGRPRDPGLESRAREAALDVFSERGFAGLTLDEVALRAKVGKSSLYLRWPDKESLLADALGHIQDDVRAPASESGDTDPDAPGRPRDDADREEPSLRDYLIAHVHRRAQLYLGKYGLAMLRLYAEARAHPDLFDHIREQAISRFVRAERERVADAIGRGILPADASPVRILDAVEGAIFMHLLVTPPGLLDRVRATLDEYIEQMVDDQLRAAGYDADADGDPAQDVDPAQADALTPPGR